MPDTRKQSILQALGAFIRQRPGLEFANYGDTSAYRSELRGITKDRHHAEELLRNVEWRDGITADQLIDAAKHSFSGRLTIKEEGDGRVSIDYCTGQYWPTEYRRAVCAVLSSALWDYWRDCKEGATGDDIRNAAKAALPRGIATRWFR